MKVDLWGKAKYLFTGEKSSTGYVSWGSVISRPVECNEAQEMVAGREVWHVARIEIGHAYTGGGDN